MTATLAATIVFAARGAAQAAPPNQAPAGPPLVISVHVIDSGRVAIEGADVAVLVGLSQSKASGATDQSGHVSLTVTHPEGDYQLVVRKIGYNRSDEFFHGKPGRLAFEVIMQRTPQSLAAVRVTAQEDLKRKSYFIDADEIAQHSDILYDASDILKKLKPDMVCGRSCNPWGNGHPRPTPAVSRPNAWVNGRRILMIATDPVCQIGRRGALTGLSPGTMQVLCEIRPEHIEQITFLDEFDNSVGKVGSNSALYIVLKEGVVYEPGKPSYVRELSEGIPGIRAALPAGQSLPLDALAVPARSDLAIALHDSTTPARDSATAVPAYRYRLLGVFDQDSGEAIDGAKVADVKTGTYANTTATGTVSLIFLPEGSSSVRITKPGYEDLNVPVDIGPAASTPITLLMKRRP